MHKVSAGVAASLLAPMHRERLGPLFAVAARKSLYAWREVEPAQAQLLLVDADSGIPPDLQAPCLVCVGAPVTAKLPQARWVARLEPGYTVGDLIDVLDRAAVFLMDWQARRAAGGAAAPVGAERRYQLAAWVSMGAPFNTGGCIRALALLTREPVTVQQLCAHGGLEASTVQALLDELSRRGVLRSTGAPAAAAPAGRRALASGGLVQRLTRWVRGGGYA